LCIHLLDFTLQVGIRRSKPSISRGDSCYQPSDYFNSSSCTLIRASFSGHGLCSPPLILSGRVTIRLQPSCSFGCSSILESLIICLAASTSAVMLRLRNGPCAYVAMTLVSAFVVQSSVQVGLFVLCFPFSPVYGMYVGMCAEC